MNLIDTHCHIHSTDYPLPPDEVIANATRAGVNKMICVGTDLDDSQQAVKFVSKNDNCWASIGIHPHDAKKVDDKTLTMLEQLVSEPKVVAVGEIGLDYYYNHSPKHAQQKILHAQLSIAKKHKLPVIFHVRDAQPIGNQKAGQAFDDFWPIYDQYKLPGVIHSFTANIAVMQQAINRGLMLGLNGIMTFTKDEEQLSMAKAVPLTNLLLETDAPYLTPTPYRGSICEPKHTRDVAQFLAEIKGEPLRTIATATNGNGSKLFGI